MFEGSESLHMKDLLERKVNKSAKGQAFNVNSKLTIDAES